MSNSPTTTETSPTSKFLRKTRAQIDKLTSNGHHPSSHDHSIETSDDILPEDKRRRAERQEKLERLAQNESIRISASASASDESTASAPYREIEMGGARKMGPEEVGKMFD